MEDERTFELKIHCHHRCYLGREPDHPADSNQTSEGNGLALIQAYVMCQLEGVLPALWILNGLGRTFVDYLNHNQESAGHENYKSIDACMGLSRKNFNAMENDTKQKIIAEQFFQLKWAFGFEHKQIINILEKCGFKIKATGKEKKDPERVYERSPFAKMYNTFETLADKTWDKNTAIRNLLEQMPDEARKYVERLIARREKKAP